MRDVMLASRAPTWAGSRQSLAERVSPAKKAPMAAEAEETLPKNNKLAEES